MSLWERFEGIATADEVATAKSQFTPLEAGDYDAVLESIEPSESKDGLPMIKGKFRTIEGNRIIFYNQMLQNLNYPNMTAVNIAEAVTFLSALKGEDIEFTGLGQLANEISNLPTGETYKLTVSYGKNDTEMKFPKVKMSKDYVPVLKDANVPF